MENEKPQELAWWEAVILLVVGIIALSAIIAVAEEVIGLRKFRMK